VLELVVNCDKVSHNKKGAITKLRYTEIENNTKEKTMGKKVNFDNVVRPASDYGKATGWMTVVLLSPRESSTRPNSDPLGRGNVSNPWGHLAYNEKLQRRQVGGKKEVQRFRFRLRKEALEPRKRSDISAVAAKKTATPAKAPAKAKSKAKRKAKA
jgi:hypothetical protein